MSAVIVEAATALSPTPATKRFHDLTDIAGSRSTLGYGIIVSSATETAYFANVDECDMPFETLEQATVGARALLAELRTLSTEAVQAHIVTIEHLTVVSA